MNVNLKTTLAVMRWTAGRGYLRPISAMSDVAADIGVTPEALSDHFLKVCRKPFSKWRKERRIAYAKRLLRRNPGLPLSEVAAAVGISDRSDFRRQFEEVCGVSPSQWAGSRRSGRNS